MTTLTKKLTKREIAAAEKAAHKAKVKAVSDRLREQLARKNEFRDLLAECVSRHDSWRNQAYCLRFDAQDSRPDLLDFEKAVSQEELLYRLAIELGLTDWLLESDYRASIFFRELF